MKNKTVLITGVSSGFGNSLIKLMLGKGWNVIGISRNLKLINQLKKDFPKLIISGDYNICHRAIDIHNPQRNKNTSGFLPEEREWMSVFITSGFIDSFRHLNPEPHNYSWWSYRANARAKNLGWRIDYNMISENLLSNLSCSAILRQAHHSDHCPVLVELEF